MVVRKSANFEAYSLVFQKLEIAILDFKMTDIDIRRQGVKSLSKIPILYDTKKCSNFPRIGGRHLRFQISKSYQRKE